jgi:hypothetical protein
MLVEKKYRYGLRTYEGDVNTTRGERAAFGRPAKPVLENPGVKHILIVSSEAKVGRSDTLQDIVIVLRDAKNARGRVRNIPTPQSYW